MLVDFLVRLQDYGPMSDEQARRQCLTLDELAALVPPPLQLKNSKAALMAMAVYMESPDHKEDFDDAINAWKIAIEEARYNMVWSKVPPAWAARAEQRVADIARSALSSQWIERNESEQLWQITPSGEDAIENLKIQQKFQR